jgi:NAD+ dependent glucose-6-phosphate dehydrogenase
MRPIQPSIHRKRVLMTGAAGRLGSVLRERLAGRYDFVFLTHQPAPFPSIVADITDLSAIAPAFKGIDAVVHLAAKARLDTPWDSVNSVNILGTYNVFEASRQGGVSQVVFASTSHVVGMYERDWGPDSYRLDDLRVLDESTPIRPDSLYALSKVFGEALARYYADRFELRVVCLRIGSVRDDDDPRSPTVAGYFHWLDLTDAQSYDRIRATWLSKRDCAELFAAALESPERWAVVFGTSDNPRQLWDLRRARELGYHPRDRAP